MDTESKEVPFGAKFFCWLRWNLYIMGASFACFIGYICYYGIPKCMKDIDAQLVEDRLDEVGKAMADLQDFKTVVAMKLEKKK